MIMAKDLAVTEGFMPIYYQRSDQNINDPSIQKYYKQVCSSFSDSYEHIDVDNSYGGIVSVNDGE